MADALHSVTATLGHPGELEQQKPDDSEDGIEEVRDMRHLPRSSEHAPSIMEPARSLCESLSLAVLTTVVEARQHIAVSKPVFAD